MDDIINSDLPDHAKELLIGYCQEPTPHSIHLITYKELLSYVWQRIIKSDHEEELLNILVEELAEAECKCFTGRFNRTLSTLVGFYDDIKINISDNSRIGTIISLVEKEIIPYNAEEHRAKSRIRLLEAGYTEEDIKEWLEHIDEEDEEG